MSTTVDTMPLQESEARQNLWTHDFLSRHHLFGYAYRKTQEKSYYPQWKTQLTRNFVIKSELEKMGEDFKRDNISVCLLKGYSLLGQVYEDWGERFASDVDVLVPMGQLWKISDILKMNGYKRRDEKKWLGNRHKTIFIKKVEDSAIVIEVHTQLFWHKPMETQKGLQSSLVEGFQVLSKENQLIHLCGHLAFQHSYLKLFWLVDIYKYIERYHKDIDWKEFWSSAIQARLFKSCYMTVFLCQKLGLNIQKIVYFAPKKKRLSIYLLKKIVNLQFLYDPRKHPVQFILVKNLIKDSVIDNLVYWGAWLQEKIMVFKERRMNS